MISQSISWLMGLFAQCYAWFIQLLDGMEVNGFTVFITIFFGLFVINRFIDLVVMRFLFSPSSVDRGASSDSFKKGAAKVKGDL